ncbi:unnamed protein product, partial [Phaeothamnion confervicola]
GYKRSRYHPPTTRRQKCQKPWQCCAGLGSRKRDTYPCERKDMLCREREKWHLFPGQLLSVLRHLAQTRPRARTAIPDQLLSFESLLDSLIRWPEWEGGCEACPAAKYACPAFDRTNLSVLVFFISSGPPLLAHAMIVCPVVSSSPTSHP